MVSVPSSNLILCAISTVSSYCCRFAVGMPPRYVPHPWVSSKSSEYVLVVSESSSNGHFLDLYPGSLENGGLSAHLRKIWNLENVAAVTSEDRISPAEGQLLEIPPSSPNLFPQFGVTGKWPPTTLVHGTHDTDMSIADEIQVVQVTFITGR